MVAVIREGDRYPRGWFRFFEIDSPCREEGLVVRIPLPWKIHYEPPWMDGAVTIYDWAVFCFVWVTRLGPCTKNDMPVEDMRWFIYPRELL